MESPAAPYPSSSVASPRADKSQVYADGMCNLCNGSVKFILPRDRKFRFQFGTLQSEATQKVLASFGANPSDLSSVVLVENGKLYTRSSAVLRIVRRLSGAWPLLYVFVIVPPFIRNAIYDWVARNRHFWFGRSTACLMPPPGWKERFLE